MKIYTKTGDGGETGLFRGPRVSKNDSRVEAYGNVDECNSLLGIALCFVKHPEIRTAVERIQQELFEVGADLATPPQEQNDAMLRIGEGMTIRLENTIDRFERDLPSLTNFILPGGSIGGAFLHNARTVCRRAERSVTTLGQEQKINPEVLRYLNRLSDLLFVLARAENHHAGSPETIWKKRNT